MPSSVLLAVAAVLIMLTVVFGDSQAATTTPAAPTATADNLAASFPAAAATSTAVGRTIDFQAIGGIPDDNTNATWWSNGALLNSTLGSLKEGDTLVIPNRTFHIMGGIHVENLIGVRFRLDGTLSYAADVKHWPRDSSGRVKECITFENVTNVVFTSNGTGTMEGNGPTWWGVPGVGYLVRGENRPRLFYIGHSHNVLFERILLHNSPYWTFLASNVDGLEVRDSAIDARRDTDDGHNAIDMTAFNTDGFDVTGRNVWIHDVSVWNQDDCIAVKDGSENMVFERVRASGVGLTIGSISGSIVNNITFRDCYMHNTYKGIYMKFRGGNSPGRISNVLYENIVIENAEQWAIWIGPAQQSDSDNLCAAHPCSICWPQLKTAQCNAPAAGTYENITLRNITITNPGMSPGVILGNTTNPIKGLVFEDVVVTNPGKKPFDGNYKCAGVKNGIAKGKTSPVPPCFVDLTTQE